MSLSMPVQTLTLKENAVTTKYGIGSLEEAEFLFNQITTSRFGDRHINTFNLLKNGWKRIGTGSAFRVVWLSPSNVAYKVQMMQGWDGYYDMNSAEVENWRKLTERGYSANVPRHTLFTFTFPNKRVEITAVEFLPYDPDSDSVYQADNKLYHTISRWIGDMHEENLYWSKDKGVFVVIDAGASSYF